MLAGSAVCSGPVGMLKCSFAVKAEDSSLARGGIRYPDCQECSLSASRSAYSELAITDRLGNVVAHCPYDALQGMSSQRAGEEDGSDVISFLGQCHNGARFERLHDICWDFALCNEEQDARKQRCTSVVPCDCFPVFSSAADGAWGFESAWRAHVLDSPRNAPLCQGLAVEIIEPNNRGL